MIGWKSDGRLLEGYTAMFVDHTSDWSNRDFSLTGVLSLHKLIYYASFEKETKIHA